MRVGKKETIVEPKKTRSCFVRLEKVPSPTNKLTHSAITSNKKGSPMPEDKKYNGPLKKRPITQITSPTYTSVTNMSTTPKPKIANKFVKETPERRSIIEEHIQTVAAGRSRRAIKPNPKYSSEDVVTPKIVKNVANLGSTIITKKLTTSADDDFFSDGVGDTEMDDIVNKAFKFSTKEVDSDYSDSRGEVKIVKEDEKEIVPQPIVRKRGRPRKSETILQKTPSTTTPSTQPSNVKTALTHRPTSINVKSNATPTHPLRKAILSSIDRTADEEPSVLTRKRKLEDRDYEVARKRFVVQSSPTIKHNSSSTEKPSTIDDIDNEKSDKKAIVLPRKSVNNQTLNGSKSENINVTRKQTTISASVTNRNVDDKRQPITKTSDNQISTKLISMKALPPKSLQSQQNIINKTKKPISNAPKLQNISNKQGSQFTIQQKPGTSPSTVTKQLTRSEIVPTISLTEDDIEDKADDSLSSNADDTEATPTFTIVNINDIINKKGDVLISKSGSKNLPSTSNSKLTEKSDNTKNVSNNNDDSSLDNNKSPPSEIRILRRRPIPQDTAKTDIPERSKNITLPPKKVAPTILNHTMFNKALNQRSPKLTTSISPEKPQPRILNSMVAKKTQPVKPMITNMDDSADESIPLSLDEDEDDDEDVDSHDNDSSYASAESFEKKSSIKKPANTPIGPLKKLPTLSTTVNKKIGPKSDDQSMSVTKNVSPSPPTEKVVVSRQGDKIIKKITCFETWYVINVPEPQPPKLTRYVLDIPLIHIANKVMDIPLPSESWRCKVTLSEVQATALEKAGRHLELYTGDLKEYNIVETDRHKYQPSCVMFRRAVRDPSKIKLPFDRAVIFKNKTFYTNIEGKNVRLQAAPAAITSFDDIRILLEIIDEVTLENSFVEPAATTI